MTRRASSTLLCAALVGLVASLVLTIDKYRILANPAYRPPCSLSDELDCTQVMTSWQASLFGFPNSLLGIAGFSVLVTVAVTLLAGFVPPQWFRFALLGGCVLGLTLVHWLVVQSAFVIGAVCLYCAAVWVVTAVSTGFAVVGVLTGIDRPAARAAAAWVPVAVVAWLCAVAITTAWGVLR